MFRAVQNSLLQTLEKIVTFSALKTVINFSSPLIKEKLQFLFLHGSESCCFQFEQYQYQLSPSCHYNLSPCLGVNEYYWLNFFFTVMK